MLLIQLCVASFAAQSASTFVVIDIDVLHFAFGVLDLTGVAVAYDISFSLRRNYFGPSYGGDDGGT